jgi:hypothetical protein
MQFLADTYGTYLGRISNRPWYAIGILTLGRKPGSISVKEAQTPPPPPRPFGSKNSAARCDVVLLVLVVMLQNG